MDNKDGVNLVYSQNSTGSQTVQCTASMTRDFLKPFLELARNKIKEIRENKAKRERVKKEQKYLKNMKKLKKINEAKNSEKKIKKKSKNSKNQENKIAENRFIENSNKKQIERNQIQENQNDFCIICFICGQSDKADQIWLNQSWTFCSICHEWLHLKCVFLGNFEQYQTCKTLPYVCFYCSRQQFAYHLTEL